MENLMFTDHEGTVRIRKSIEGKRVSYLYEGERLTGTVLEWLDVRSGRVAGVCEVVMVSNDQNGPDAFTSIDAKNNAIELI